ncbi:D-alanyl-D-alanine carboxypeptidase/D-alanyl-D-alanine endopeptidase [Propionibacterium australiense]|uniref:D-alanyl-D-alanine carboxypeptidase/D-alanyl-D-alanine endopeptidase n=1 Tax=Propionibacterium australiense TaxID=119981 RepID=UPI000E5A5884|nr:D-alanyl-D-alanine carboxypeptidase/D-alanyl-D-alanine-endopeptidase [Propionibacterium australiense]RLP09745.1 D-alanyl-D-alanine carboxypeptidase/D-alanyl-D-alanine-endopeptidase [Propionibacterium australiense]
MNSRRKQSGRRWRILAGVLAVVLAGAGLALRFAAGPAGLLVEGGAATVSPGLYGATDDGTGAIDPATGPGQYPALSADRTSQALTAAGLDQSWSVSVRDLSSGDEVFDQNGSQAIIPASNMKLMTTMSLLDAAGAGTTYRTRVVAESDGSYTLVGGGDPLLASTESAYQYEDPGPATSAELAEQTARALTGSSVTSITLNYDESLFSGPTRHPDWAEGDMEYVNDISALTIDQGDDSGDSAAAAARVFAEQLTAAGISLAGDPAPRTAGQDADTIAEVESLPLGRLAQICLRHSDNSMAETLLRHLAISAGQPATFNGGVAALEQRMRALGVWSDADALHDGSGLSERNRLTADTLSRIVVVAAGSDDMRIGLAGMPVAAATGSLQTRYLDSASSAGAGLVRAKTGTLDVASTLTGYTPTADGSIAVFTIVINGAGTEARPHLDALAAALAACRCAA